MFLVLTNSDIKTNKKTNKKCHSHIFSFKFLGTFVKKFLTLLESDKFYEFLKNHHDQYFKFSEFLLLIFILFHYFGAFGSGFRKLQYCTQLRILFNKSHWPIQYFREEKRTFVTLSSWKTTCTLHNPNSLRKSVLENIWSFFFLATMLYWICL